MTQSQFLSLYNTNSSALMNFALKLTKNRYEAEDLVQETALKAFKNGHTFNEGSSFKSWAFTILKNTFITKYNRKKKRGVVNAPIEDFTYAIESKNTINNGAMSRLKIGEINNCIENLSYKSKMPFLLHVEGYQYNEISQSLNIPIGTVKSRINFARKKLKGMLEELDIRSAA